MNNKNKILSENDPLGGEDPYSASKAATEVLSYSYIKSYNFKIATARGGTVIGGGDWNDNRLVPDIMRSIFLKKKLNKGFNLTKEGQIIRFSFFEI